MTRTRYRIFEDEYAYFLTCTIAGWLPVFTRPEAVRIVFDSWNHLAKEKLEYMHNNPVKRGYVDEPVHWRYSSARNYAGKAGLAKVVTDWR